MSQAEWDQLLCEMNYMGLLEEQFRTVLDQQEEDE
jgi:hypothetical protein